MAREQFAFGESETLLKSLDEAAHRSGVSRGQTFEDFLIMAISALSGGRMEEQYLAAVKKHSEGAKGKRGVDTLGRMFAELVEAMEETRHDILGDLFQGAITFGEKGQFFTPEPICDRMARMTVGEVTEDEARKEKSVFDPCCGSGRMLLAVSKISRHWQFVGQDIDIRCVRIATINLALYNLYGYILWGDSLTNDVRLIYRTGFNLVGVIREATAAEFHHRFAGKLDVEGASSESPQLASSGSNASSSTAEPETTCTQSPDLPNSSPDAKPPTPRDGRQLRFF